MKELGNINHIASDITFSHLIISPIGNPEALSKINIPIILFDRDIQGSPHPFFGIDNEYACYNLCKAIYDESKKNKIAYLSYNTEEYIHEYRLNGYMKFIREIKQDPLVLSLNERNEYFDFNIFLKQKNISHFVCSSNLMMHSVLKNLKGETYKKIKSIATFDKNKWFFLLNVDIYYVRQPIAELVISISEMINSEKKIVIGLKKINYLPTEIKRSFRNQS